MKKWQILVIAALCCVTSLCFGAEKTPTETPNTAVAADVTPYSRKQIAFVVYDTTGNATSTMKAVWKRQVRQAYPRKSYGFMEDPQAATAAGEVLQQYGGISYPIEKPVMAKIAEKAKADVVAIVVVRAMEEYYVEPLLLDPFDGSETWLRVVSGADLYIYKQEGDQYKKKKLRKIRTTDVARAVHPQQEIQYALSDLAMDMEGKEHI